ncbi:MAG: c-type cytochrome [Verrucomicrobiota bacterium]|jgi:cytochrome c553
MKLRHAVFCGAAGAVFAAAGLFAEGVKSTNETVTSTPVYVPDTSHSNDPLPDGVLVWNSLMQTTNVPADQDFVRFNFSFTNVATRMDITLAANVSTTADLATSTNITAITNFTPVSVTILDVHASCGCTQPELPPRPWTIPASGNGEFSATVNLEGKSGTMVKSVTVVTDKGSKTLYFKITILPPVVPNLTDAERARGVEIAKADRQAVFKADCATCHAKSTEGKYGQKVYDAVCAICHEAEHRAAIVPDLHNLKTPTSNEFWRTWAAHGKAGTLMPAFSTAEGGPLNDMQIATVAAYLNMAIPPQPAPPAPNAPPAK